MLTRFKGLTRNEFEAEVRARSRCEYVGKYQSVCRVLGDALIYVDTRDFALAPHLMMDGFWESWITLAMMRAVQPGMTAVDVGANLGYYSIVLGKCVGTAGSVIAYEPNPALVSMMTKSFVASGVVSAVKIDPRAAYSETGNSVRLLIPDGHPMNASIVPDGVEFQGGQTIFVDTVRLGESLPNKVDFIKIDAEGAEHHIWKGLQSTLSKNASVRIFLEFNPARVRHYDPSQFLADIEGSGFALAQVGFEAERVPRTTEELLAGDEVMLDLVRPEAWPALFSNEPDVG